MSRKNEAVVSWPSLKILSSRNQLEKLRKTLEDYPTDDIEVEAALCRFLVLRSCGHVELCLEQGVVDFLEKTAPPHVHGYIRSGMFKGRNPWPNRIEELLGAFFDDWGRQIKEFLDADDELLNRELKFLIQKRNSIAHGQSEGVARRKALDLCDYAILLADKIIDIVAPVRE